MRLRITVLPGDGIGPEVTTQAVQVLRTVADVCGYNFEFTTRLIGGAAVEDSGHPLPKKTLDTCLESDAVLLGAVGGPKFDGLAPHLRPEAGLLAIRQALGCYANLRPAIAHESIADCSPLRPEVRRGADVLIVRELLGGLYFGEPRAIDEEHHSAYNTMRYSEHEIERIAKVAFEAARERKKKVTSVDKANVLETSRYWRTVVTRVAKEYPDVKLEHALVDSFAMQLITTPSRYDVVVTENLFGDILSDEAAVISGSLGLLSSASIGGAVGLYEPVHGSAPDIAGKGIANPLGAIASAAMLLRYSAKLIGEADGIDAAIRNTLDAGYRTADLATSEATKKRANTTEQVGAKVTETVSDMLNRRMAYHAV
jgi:3-isopropylmalate dehydrogenase